MTSCLGPRGLLPSTGAASADCEGQAKAGQAASALARRGLQAPVLLLLDLASPFRFLLQQALLVAHPLVAPWAGDRLMAWAGLLDDPAALEDVRRRLAEH